jgi:hypothetical protein
MIMHMVRSGYVEISMIRTKTTILGTKNNYFVKKKKNNYFKID